MGDLHNYTTDPNNIDEFATLLRESLPEVIREQTDGAVEQQSDCELMAWTANREAAFEIRLSNGAVYQITLKQTASAEDEAPECRECGDRFDHEDELENGFCLDCADVLAKGSTS